MAYNLTLSFERKNPGGVCYGRFFANDFSPSSGSFRIRSFNISNGNTIFSLGPCTTITTHLDHDCFTNDKLYVHEKVVYNIVGEADDYYTFTNATNLTVPGTGEPYILTASEYANSSNQNKYRAFCLAADADSLSNYGDLYCSFITYTGNSSPDALCLLNPYGNHVWNRYNGTNNVYLNKSSLAEYDSGQSTISFKLGGRYYGNLQRRLNGTVTSYISYAIFYFGDINITFAMDGLHVVFEKYNRPVFNSTNKPENITTHSFDVDYASTYNATDYYHIIADSYIHAKTFPNNQSSVGLGLWTGETSDSVYHIDGIGWSKNKTFVSGNIVKENDKYYRCDKATTNTEKFNTDNAWTEVTTTYLYNTFPDTGLYVKSGSLSIAESPSSTSGGGSSGGGSSATTTDTYQIWITDSLENNATNLATNYSWSHTYDGNIYYARLYNANQSSPGFVDDSNIHWLMRTPGTNQLVWNARGSYIELSDALSQVYLYANGYTEQDEFTVKIDKATITPELKSGVTISKYYDGSSLAVVNNEMFNYPGIVNSDNNEGNLRIYPTGEYVNSNNSVLGSANSDTTSIDVDLNFRLDGEKANNYEVDYQNVSTVKGTIYGLASGSTPDQNGYEINILQPSSLVGTFNGHSGMYHASGYTAHVTKNGTHVSDTDYEFSWIKIYTKNNESTRSTSSPYNQLKCYDSGDYEIVVYVKGKTNSNEYNKGYVYIGQTTLAISPVLSISWIAATY